MRAVHIRFLFDAYYSYIISLLSKADELEKREEVLKKSAEQDHTRKKAADLMRSKNMENFKMTTGYQFDGYRTTEYLNVVSGELVLGTGFFSALSANISDVLGTTSGAYESKLGEARV